MAPRSQSSSRTPSSFFQSKQRQATIPQNLFRIPKDQKELLDRPDSWEASLANSDLGLVNVPTGVLDSLKYFESSRVLPPGAQKPLSSGAPVSKSTVNGSASTDGHGNSDDGIRAQDQVDDDEGGESESGDGASAVSWSPSPPPKKTEHTAQPVDLRNGPDSGESINGSIPLPSLSSPAQARRPQETKTLKTPKVARNTFQKSPHAMFETQAPLPEMDDSSSPVKTNDSVPVPRNQIETQASPMSARRQQKPPQVSFPPSSLDQEEDMEMEIPGALSHATPPINKISSRLNASQGVVLDTPPPCGQGSGSRPSYASARTQAKISNPPKQRWKALKFSDGPDIPTAVIISETPATAPKAMASESIEFEYGQTLSQALVASTFPSTEVAQGQEFSIAEQTSAASSNPRGLIATLSSTGVQETPSRVHAQIHHSPPNLPANKRAPAFSSPKETIPFTDGPDFRERFLLKPLETFQSAYRSFDGSLGDFVRACVSLKSLRRERKLPVFLYDDFVRVFCDDYIRYVSETDEPRPMYAMEWYVDNVSKPIYQKGVLTKDNIDRVLKMYPEEYNAIQESLGLSRSYSPATNAGNRSSLMAIDPPEPQPVVQQPKIDAPANDSNLIPRTLRNPDVIVRRHISDQSGDSANEVFVSASESIMSGVEDSPVHKSHIRRSPSSDVEIVSSTRRANVMGSTPPQPYRRRLPPTEVGQLRRSPESKAAISPPREAFRKDVRETSMSRSKGKAPARYSLDGRGQTHRAEVMSASGRVASSRQSLPPLRHHTSSVGQVNHGDELPPHHGNADKSKTEAKPRALPRSFLTHGTTTRPRTPFTNSPAAASSAARLKETPAASGSRLSTSRPSAYRLPTLTQESGVSKQKKQASRAEQYRLKLEKLKAAGRLPGMAGSSTPRS